MTPGNIITIALFLIANGVIVAVAWGKVSSRLQTVEQEQKDDTLKLEETIHGIIEHTERTYQRKDMCAQMSKEFTSSLRQIQNLDLSARFTKIETQLSQVQAGIEELKRK